VTLRNIGVWIAQLILALFFIFFGICAQAGIGIIGRGLPRELVIILGLAQVGFAVALLVPSFSRALPILTPVAVCGFLSMLVYPLTEGAIVLLNVLGLLAFVVVWGRFKTVRVAKGASATGDSDLSLAGQPGSSDG
jgi:hypothetical protein